MGGYLNLSFYSTHIYQTDQCVQNCMSHVPTHLPLSSSWEIDPLIPPSAYYR